VKVFVTGGTGFVGSHLVTALLARGDDVVILARDPAKVERVFSGAARPRVVRGDLSHPDAIREAASGAELVFHVAGLIAARGGPEFLSANAEGTRLVANVTAQVAPDLKRFVYVSSLAAAGPSRRGEPLTEAVPPRPLTMYGRSKLAGEEAVATFDFPWTIIRPPVVYGPRDTEMFRVFRLASLGLAAVFGNGSQELSFIYVEDLVSALLRAGELRSPRGVYFAAHPEVVTTRSLVTAVHRAVRSVGLPEPFAGGPPFILPIPGLMAKGGLWITERAAGLFGRATLLTVDKANEFLAEAWVCSPAAFQRDAIWQPEWDLARGLARTAAWYKQTGWL
jgi:nucleoside-diphosphate-sugar epimerase